MKKPSALFRRMILMLVMAALAGQACTLSLFDNPLNPGGEDTFTPIPGEAVASPTPRAVAQTNFIVTLPEPLQPGETLAIAVMDEVTGLSLNAAQYPMSPRDSITYTAVLPLPYNSVVKDRKSTRLNSSHT